MTERVEVGALEELPEGERKIVQTPAGPVGVFNVEGEFYALSNNCCHLNGPVCKGAIKREISAEYLGPGKRIKERLTDIPTIACPWHGWEYRMETGEQLGDGDIVLETFDVIVEDDTIFIDV